ncbi:MAG: nucleotidyltransferase domain-containing protein [Bacteroidetes bacterium]|nr:nucleotidyltransferase domain-containing protein [Bacteroidota bacterium]MBU2585854.1 nucleotidyltransferase domain-containing protein [Bacteroidota bacterium]
MKNKNLNHLSKLKEILLSKFGTLIESIYFYGSQVKMERTDSDLDILIVTKESIDWKQEYEISSVIIDYGIEHEIVFDPKFLSKTNFEVTYRLMPFVKNVKSQGVPI